MKKPVFELPSLQYGFSALVGLGLTLGLAVIVTLAFLLSASQGPTGPGNVTPPVTVTGNTLETETLNIASPPQ